MDSGSDIDRIVPHAMRELHAQHREEGEHPKFRGNVSTQLVGVEQPVERRWHNECEGSCGSKAPGHVFSFERSPDLAVMATTDKQNEQEGQSRQQRGSHAR